MRLQVTGTLTLDGSISADGGGGLNGFTNGTGGGAGGSIYLTADTVACTSVAPTLSAVGGDGGDGTSSDSGGGGGGRIAIEYASAGGTCAFNPFADTIDGNDATFFTVGGVGPGTANDGGTGTLELITSDSPPAFSVAVNANPPVITSAQTTVISATATDDNGVDQIKLFLDGTADPANVIKTCTFAPAQLSATCSETVGPSLSDGTHTIRATARDTAAQTANSDGSFEVGTFTFHGRITLSREKVSTTGVSLALTETTLSADTGAFTVRFPAGFTVTGAFTSGTCSNGGTIGSFGFTASTLTATATGCLGTVALTGAEVTLPGTPGTYVITWDNEMGRAAVPIVADDSVTYSFEVEPTITFDIDVATSDTNSNAPYAVALGELSAGTLTTSNQSSVASIFLDLSSNATGGVIVTVRGSSGGLYSPSAGNTITLGSAEESIAAGQAKFGLCVESASASVGTLAAGSQYDSSGGACSLSNSGTQVVGRLETAPTQIFATGGNPIGSGRAEILLKGSIAPTTPGGTDYATNITFIATGTY